jgi:hypothetical protein
VEDGLLKNEECPLKLFMACALDLIIRFTLLRKSSSAALSMNEHRAHSEEKKEPFVSL